MVRQRESVRPDQAEEIMSETEQWRPVPGWEGKYEVSSDGRVMSLSRFTSTGQPVGGFALTPRLNKYGHLNVGLHLNGKASNQYIHRLVMLAFVGPCPDGQEVLHRDGIPTNNRLDNLSYGTRSQNVQDTLRHGTNVNAAKTHCKHGHEFTVENTYRRRGNERHCRTCADDRRRRYLERKAEAA